MISIIHLIQCFWVFSFYLPLPNPCPQLIFRPNCLQVSRKHPQTSDDEQLKKSPYNTDLLEDYRNIMDICNNKQEIPRISLEDSTKILLGLKSTVKDFYSITPSHFTNAGIKGFNHFNFLLNAIIQDINNSSIEEMNTASLPPLP